MLRIRCRGMLLPAILAGGTLWGQSLEQFEKKVTEFTLPNGLHFIVAERHEAPVVSFRTWVDAGSKDDPAGTTGMAHMFEHLAFKGTDTIGTSDWAAEKKALDAVEEANDKLQAERDKGSRADEERVGTLERQLTAAIDRAHTFARPNEFASILEANGSDGLNAGTGFDHTEYFCSLPSNRLELWFLMESQRFLSPVFREFYKERDVVLEEQRMRVESNAQGLLLQQYEATAFETPPFHNPGVGWPGDIQRLRSTDARAFFEKYYTASNMVIAIVGDVNAAEARRLAERYFGPLPTRPAPEPSHNAEMAQRGPKRIQIEMNSQPLLLCGYKRPDQRDPDNAALHVLGLVLSSGRTGVLYKELVEGQRVALEAQAVAAFPLARYPSAFTFFLVPAREHTAEENERALDGLLARFAMQKVDEETLLRARSKARMELISKLNSNAGLAGLLPSYYTAYGDWRKLFTSIDDLNKVTADDVQRVARKYLVPSQKTVAYLGPPAVAAGRGGR